MKWIWKDNDIISIKLDLKQRNIEYFVNDKSLGVVFENVPIGEDIKYRLAMGLGSEGQHVVLKSVQYL